MRWFTATWCLMMAALLGLPTVSAQEAQFASLGERLAEVEAELARYRSGDSFGASCEDPGYDVDCRTPGLVFGAELAFLKPSHTEGQTPDYDYEATPRLWIGWQRADGLGARVRWFEFDAHTNNEANARIDDLNMMTLDLELTDTFTLGSKWEGLFSGGLRYAQYKEDYASPPGNNFLEIDEAYGLILGMELYRPVWNNLYVFGIVRGSAMFGEDTFDNTNVVTDSTFFITEFQLGAEYRRTLCGTTYLFARGAVEAQYWNGVSDSDSEDTSLSGVAFSVGLAR